MKSIQILLVEDNLGDARLTQEALKEGKLCDIATLTHVRDGIEAMSYLRRGPGYGDAARPDWILLDLNMPRKNGREVLAEIKSDDDLRTIPIAVLTTSHSEHDILKSYDLHANCYIFKPVEMDKFIDLLKGATEFWFNIVTLPENSSDPENAKVSKPD